MEEATATLRDKMSQPGGSQMNKILSQSPAPCNQAAQLSLSAGDTPTSVKANAKPANHHAARLLSYPNCENTSPQLAWTTSKHSKGKSLRTDLFTWFKNRRRKKIIAQRWPEAWSLHLNRNVRLTWGLTETQIARLREIIKSFVAEKNWEGCEGLAVTEEMQVTIAAQAGLLLLGTPNFYFDNVRTILVFPKSFSREVIDGGVVGQTYRAGEAWQGGPIILSWQDTLRGGRNEDDGRNLVIHEFAHALDGLDGEMAGQIVFDDSEISTRWNTVVNREFAKLCHARDQGIRTLLDHYGATNKAEFFAVSSETFVELPEEFQQQHAELFELLSTYYRVDPRQWLRAKPRNR